MSVTLTNLLWSTAHVKSQICLTRLCKHDGQRWRKAAANRILWSIVFNCFVSQQVFTAGTKNKHKHLPKSEDQAHVLLLLNILNLVPKFCTEVVWALWTTEIPINSAANPTSTSWLSTVIPEPSGSHARNVNVITPLITQKWKKFCLISGSKQQWFTSLLGQ